MVGKKRQPLYRIVVSETRNKRDGKFLDIIGSYDPSFNHPVLKLNQELFDQWVKKGAIISDGLKKILKT